MELGKDILAIAPDGVPCAYQLKGGNVTLTRWKNEINTQMVDLVLGQIVHPSIDSTRPYRAYLVINGNIEEEASRAITDFNQARIQEGRPDQIINTIVRGELFEKFKALQGNFWPAELVDVKTFLELYLESGRGRLPKSKLAQLFESTMPLMPEDGQKPPNTQCSRAIAGSALLCSSAISSFSNEDNHVAEFEAWVIYFSYILALAEKWNLPKEYWQPEIEIALKSIYNSLSRLCDELMKRSHFVEGNPYTDQAVFRVRLTYLLGLMGTYAIWRKLSNESENEQDEFLRGFCLKNRTKLLLWGEHAIPQVLGFYFYYRTIEVGLHADFMLQHLMTAIAEANG